MPYGDGMEMNGSYAMVGFCSFYKVRSAKVAGSTHTDSFR
jgi:hypothetical protein